VARDRRRRLVGLLLAFVLAAFWRLGARASAQEVPTTDSPVVFVQLQSGAVTIVTGRGPGVLLQADPGVTYQHIAASPQVDARIPGQVRLWAQTIRTPAGQLSLPPEPFIFPPLAPELHDAVIVRGAGNVSLQLPENTALVVANVRRGSVQIDGYHGVFVTHVANGQVMLNGVGGTGAVQMGAGRLTAINSNFVRLRARTARADMIFRNCNAQQIQATSLVGSILYDNGTFAPGLARFESMRGNVAVGVASGGAQIGAHSDTGQIYSGFEGTPAQVNRAAPTDSQTVVAGGGPVVTATSGTGSVLLYNGSLRDHPQLMQRLPPRMRSAAQVRFAPRAFPPRRGRPPARRLKAKTCARPRCPA
jgi:hypothetical protein